MKISLFCLISILEANYIIFVLFLWHALKSFCIVPISGIAGCIMLSKVSCNSELSKEKFRTAYKIHRCYAEGLNHGCIWD